MAVEIMTLFVVPQFDEQAHTYRIDNQVVPSVTQIIRAVVPCFAAEQFYRDRGTQVHRAIALLIHQELDWSTVDHRIVPFVQAAEKALSTLWPSGVGTTAQIEQPLASPLYRFAGTPDLIDAGILADWKTNSCGPEVEAQVGGYSVLAGGNVRRAVSFVLNDDGTFRMTEWKLPRAKAVFMACLTLRNWASDAGVTLQKEERT